MYLATAEDVSHQVVDQRRMRVKNIGGGLSTTWLLGHGKAEGVGRGMCSLPRRARRKFCWHMHKIETILYNKLRTIM